MDSATLVHEKGRAGDLEKQLFARWKGLHLTPADVALRLEKTEKEEKLSDLKLRILTKHIESLDTNDLGLMFSLAKMFSKLSKDKGV